MEFVRIYAEFEAPELAELAGGSIRRKLRGVHRITVHPVGAGKQAHTGYERFTMLPANLSMMNYATDVLHAEIASSSIPEPMQRRTTELLVVCDAAAARSVTNILHQFGGNRIRQNG